MYAANFIYFLNIVTLLDTRHLCFILSYCIFVSRLVICCSKFFMSGIIIIFVIIIRLHRYCYRVAWSVTVCRSRSWALWKWLNQSRWCLGAETDWPKEPLLVGGADPQLEGAIFQGCLAHWKPLGVFTTVYTKKQLNRSGLTRGVTRLMMQPFLKILWPFVIVRPHRI